MERDTSRFLPADAKSESLSSIRRRARSLSGDEPVSLDSPNSASPPSMSRAEEAEARFLRRSAAASADSSIGETPRGAAAIPPTAVPDEDYENEQLDKIRGSQIKVVKRSTNLAAGGDPTAPADIVRLEDAAGNCFAEQG